MAPFFTAPFKSVFEVSFCEYQGSLHAFLRSSLLSLRLLEWLRDCRNRKNTRNEQMVSAQIDQRLPVRWQETRQRFGYDAEYVSIGSMPGLIKDSFEYDDIVRKLLCDSLVLSRRGRETKEVDEYSGLVSALFLKLLQRGRMPLPTLEIERAAISAFDLEEYTNDLSEIDGGELGWESKSGNRYKIDRDKFISRLSQRRRFELEAGFQEPLLDSSYELQFLTQWVSQNLG